MLMFKISLVLAYFKIQMKCIFMYILNNLKIFLINSAEIKNNK